MAGQARPVPPRRSPSTRSSPWCCRSVVRPCTCCCGSTAAARRRARGPSRVGPLWASDGETLGAVRRPPAGGEGGRAAPGAPRAAGDPQRSRPRPPAPGPGHRLPRPRARGRSEHADQPARRTPRGIRSTALPPMAFDHALDHPQRGRAGCAPSSATPTSASPSHRRCSPRLSCSRSTGPRWATTSPRTNLKRILLRREQIVADRRRVAPPGTIGGRPAAQYRFRARQIEVTDQFAVLRPPDAHAVTLRVTSTAQVASIDDGVPRARAPRVVPRPAAPRDR